MSWITLALSLSLAAPGDRYGDSLLPGSTTAMTAPADSDPLGLRDPFAWDVPASEVAAGGKGAITLRLAVPAGTHVYRDGIEITVKDAGGLVLGAVSIPAGEKRADPGEPSGEIREVYDTDVLITIPVTATGAAATPGLHTVTLDVRHQGCRTGLCYPPVGSTLSALVHVKG